MTSLAVDPSHDELQTDAGVPGWSENLVVQAHDATAGLSVWAHWSRIPGASHIWEGVLAVYLPGGELLVSRTFGPGTEEQTASSGPLSFACLEPSKKWRMRFDGMARRATSGALAAATLEDGPSERVLIELDFDAVHPIWSAHGNMEGQSWGTAHLEQGGRLTGQAIIGGEVAAINTGGFRDHSYGPRNYSGMAGNTWCTAVFPSGRALLGLNVWQTAGPAMAVGFVWDGEEMLNATSVALPRLADADGQPSTCEFEITTTKSTERITVVQHHRMTWTLDEPVGMTAGANGETDGIRVVESPATVTWGEEAADGWIEKTLRPSQFNA